MKSMLESRGSRNLGTISIPGKCAPWLRQSTILRRTTDMAANACS
jgi:hypothetical protein